MSATDTPTVQNPIPDLTTGFLRDMLVIVDSFDEKPSGQMVKERMEQVGGYDNLNHGQLYPNLDTLVELGYVRKGEIDKRTNWYVASEKGEQKLEDYSEFVGA